MLPFSLSVMSSLTLLTKKTLFILGLCLLTACNVAFADSDGYFCVAPGYLAYEVRSWTSGLEHELRVIRVGNPIGIHPSTKVTLPEFQVHAMRCLHSKVEIHGWDKLYTVTLGESVAPASVEAAPVQGPPSSEPLKNLASWGHAQVVEIPSDDKQHKYELVIAKVSKRLERGIDHFTNSQIVERGNDGEIIDSIQLFNVVFLETVD